MKCFQTYLFCKSFLCMFHLTAVDAREMSRLLKIEINL